MLLTKLEPLFSLTEEQLEDITGEHVKTAVQAALPAVASISLDFIAKQFGIDRIKKLFREKIKDLPATLEAKLKTFVNEKVAAIRQAALGSSQNIYAGQVGQRYTFHYQNKTYTLIVARLTNSKEILPYVLRVIADGKVVVELDAGQINANSFPNVADKTAMLAAYGAVRTAAGNLEEGLVLSRRLAQEKRKVRRKGKSGVTGTGNPPENPQKVKLAELAASLRTAIGTESTSGDPNSGTGLLRYLSRFGCALLNAGCFAAGTKLNTPNGFRNVEDLTEGDLVYAKSEFDPAAPIEAKPIEQVFRRFTEIVHVHAGGQLLRTTQEHPFYVHERGWTPVAEINPGDWLLTDTGHWQQVDEVFFTGELEVVYNLRVADYHTYFVGDDGWGFSVWAHNVCIALGLTKLGDTKLLEPFRDAVAPDAAIYTEWKAKGITTSNDFGVALQQALSKATTIYMNLQGIDDVPQSVKNGRRGLNVIPAGQPSNYTNYELYQLSLKSEYGDGISTGAQYRAKIKWYNSVTPASEPADFPSLHSK